MPESEELLRAAEAIREGRLVAFPTETVYGLGANAFDAAAVERIYTAKGRPSSSPLIVHVADEAMARSLAAEWPDVAHLLGSTFWPGPLTLVVKKTSAIPDIVTGGLNSVGLRVPSHPVALELIRLAGVPIAAPSANRFMEISPTTAEHVRASLGDRVDIILDDGPTQVGIESTVVSLTGEMPVVLRPGMISQAELETVTGKPWGVISLAVKAESPGMLSKHYAPRTRFYVLDASETLPYGRGFILEMPTDPKEYASVLYAELHRADNEGWDWIAVAKPPDTPAWAGIWDRLKRASRR